MEKYVMDVRALIISVEIVLCISKKKKKKNSKTL